eukprot:s3714_g6.t1
MQAASGGYRFGEPEAVESLEEQSLRERLRSLEHELAQKGGRDGEDWGHRKSQLRASIDGAAAAVQDLREQRNSILRGDDPKIREEQQTREEIKRFKASERYATEAELDVRIEELETLMSDSQRGWRAARDADPAFFREVSVISQPSANVDAVIVCSDEELPALTPA